MQFTTREDIEAPIEYVFGVVSDFEGFQRQAMRRGAEVARCDDLSAPGAGMRWDAAFPFRGKRREIKIEMVDYIPPNQMVFVSQMTGMSGVLSMDLLALSRGAHAVGHDDRDEAAKPVSKAFGPVNEACTGQSEQAFQGAGGGVCQDHRGPVSANGLKVADDIRLVG